MVLSILNAILTGLGGTVGLAGVILANRATTQEQDAVERASEEAKLRNDELISAIKEIPQDLVRILPLSNVVSHFPLYETHITTS